ncbi:uncharacterized protein RSE6_14808 [Rhynchosporium secalis]|uniref:Uncharacterized protein n=1 Tax=Rhynchosporium secalis TaxID=38038 RepID=A0A1E1MW69_RHYSE|nr:uncharacterized protein RSE6_14808 [Rhynchosporium secalis]
MSVGWTQAQIALQLNLTRDQVSYAISTRLTPQHHLRGRKAHLNTPQRKRLIEWVTTSRINRRTPWVEIPSILKWNVGLFAIRTAVKKGGLLDESHAENLTFLMITKSRDFRDYRA